MRLARGPLLALGLALAPSAAWAAKAIPPPPQYFVHDEPQVMSELRRQGLQLLLAEHERVTGEQVVVAVFDSLEGEDLVDYTNRVFQAWKIGNRSRNNGVLLAVFWKDHKSRIEVGYGLEPVLTDAKSSEILNDVLAPELRSGDVDLAFARAALQILTVLESPLIASGQARDILERSVSPNRPVRNRQDGSGAPASLFFGLLFATWILNRILRGDAHYTSRGWYRPRRRGIFIGGWGGGGGFGSGGFGGGGGFGGFGGGGGRSGGGGASGSW